MLEIRNNKVFTSEGEYLKTIYCPKKIHVKNLEKLDKYNLYCTGCKKNILDTDYVLEGKLIEKLKRDKDICLKINRLNPMFRFV